MCHEKKYKNAYFCLTLENRTCKKWAPGYLCQFYYLFAMFIVLNFTLRLGFFMQLLDADVLHHNSRWLHH